MNQKQKAWQQVKLFIVLQALPAGFLLFLLVGYIVSGTSGGYDIQIEAIRNQEFTQGFEFTLFLFLAGLPFTAYFLHDNKTRYN